MPPVSDLFGGSSSSSSDPYFAKPQKAALGDAFRQLVIPALFGGAPSFAAERARADGEQAVLRSTADSGLTPEDGITQARLAMNDAQAMAIDEQETMQMLQLLLTPLGNRTNSNTHSGFNDVISGLGGMFTFGAPGG